MSDKTSREHTLAATARGKFERLLPPDYSTRREAEGWIDLDPRRATGVIRGPRSRNNMLLNVCQNLFGLGRERYIEEIRSGVLGHVAVEGWADSTPITQLRVRDANYTPTHPVDDKTDPIRYTEATYVIGATTDEDDGYHESGITFRFLERGANLHSTLVHHTVSPHGPYDLTPDFLSSYNFPPIGERLGLQPRIVELADLCIKLAGEST